MVLLARLLLGAACALAAPAAHARSWVMTPDPAVNDLAEFSAVEVPPEAIGAVNEQQSLSVHFGYLAAGGDVETAVHFDQPASRVWFQLDPPCFDDFGGFFELTGVTTGQTIDVGGQLVYFDSVLGTEGSNCIGTGPLSGIFTYEFPVLPTQVDF